VDYTPPGFFTPEMLEIFQKDRIVGDAFKNAYHKDHCACPLCGSTKNCQTYVGYIVHVDNGVVLNADEFKDENNILCKCGWKGIVHELVSE